MGWLVGQLVRSAISFFSSHYFRHLLLFGRGSNPRSIWSFWASISNVNVTWRTANQYLSLFDLQQCILFYVLHLFKCWMRKKNTPTSCPLHLQLSSMTTFPYLDLFQFHLGYLGTDFVGHWSSPMHLSIFRCPKAVLCESESPKSTSTIFASKCNYLEI